MCDVQELGSGPEGSASRPGGAGGRPGGAGHRGNASISMTRDLLVDALGGLVGEMRAREIVQVRW